MWQGVGAYSRGLGHVTRARGIWQGAGWGHVAGAGICGRVWGLWQGVVACGRVWAHVAGCWGMW